MPELTDPPSPQTPSPPKTRWQRLRAQFSMERIKLLVSEYGPIALVVWYAVFGLTIVGFYFAIKWGFKPETLTAKTGIWGAAYLSAKVTTPLRAIVVFTITPIVARFWYRIRGKPRPT